HREARPSHGDLRTTSGVRRGDRVGRNCNGHFRPGRAEESAVGDRVRFDGPRWTGESGRLVADYAEFMVADGRLDRDWAPPRRWAVALDSGRLTFADDAELEPMTDGEDAQPSSVNE
ncbi:hypothetical protein, partial [Rhodococcus sp. 05-340-2]|uniref:hypothetical protein n=1 Tax=Rhodococcus sp. 05-340-2 TaxID=2022504 RepID=UPI000B9C1BF7